MTRPDIKRTMPIAYTIGAFCNLAGACAWLYISTLQPLLPRQAAGTCVLIMLAVFLSARASREMAEEDDGGYTLDAILVVGLSCASMVCLLWGSNLLWAYLAAMGLAVSGACLSHKGSATKRLPQHAVEPLLEKPRVETV